MSGMGDLPKELKQTILEFLNLDLWGELRLINDNFDEAVSTFQDERLMAKAMKELDQLEASIAKRIVAWKKRVVKAKGDLPEDLKKQFAAKRKEWIRDVKKFAKLRRNLVKNRDLLTQELEAFDERIGELIEKIDELVFWLDTAKRATYA